MNALQKPRRDRSTREDRPAKKLETRRPFDTKYKTPRPSSVGSYFSPSKFTPPPKAQYRTHRRTSSANLKENASVLPTSRFLTSKSKHNLRNYGKLHRRYAVRKRGIALGNPFNDCSGSASSTSGSGLGQKAVINKKHTSHLTASSPVPAGVPPSGPSPPIISSWKHAPSYTALLFELYAPLTSNIGKARNADLPLDAFHPQPVVRPSPPHSQLDFSRRPSQHSIYDYTRSVSYENEIQTDKPDLDIEDFFSDVLATSTPFNPLSSLRSNQSCLAGIATPDTLSRAVLSRWRESIAETDTDNETDDDSVGFDPDEEMVAPKPLKSPMRIKSKSRSVFVTPHIDTGDEEIGYMSPWIGHSSVSSLKTVDWKQVPIRPENDAYTRADIDMATAYLEPRPEHELQGLSTHVFILRNGDSHMPTDDAVSSCAPLPLRTHSLASTVSACPSERTILTSNLAPPLPIVEERKSGGESFPSAIPIRHDLRGSIVAATTIHEALTSAGPPTVTTPCARIRNTVGLGHTLANFPRQVVGIVEQRDGIVAPPPSSTEAHSENAIGKSAGTPYSEDVELPRRQGLKVASSTKAHSSPISPRNTIDLEDTLNLLDKPTTVLSSPKSTGSLATGVNTAFSARSFHGPAKASASKTKGFRKSLARKGGIKGKVLTGPEAGAAALARAKARAELRLAEVGPSDDGENSSDDELLLK